MKTRINLIPPEARKKEMKWDRQLPGDWKWILMLVLPLVIWKLSVTLLLARIKSDLHTMREETNAYASKVANLKVSVETDLKVKQDKINNVKTAIAEKEKELDDFGAVAELSSSKGKFIHTLLKKISESIPEEVWLDELGFDKEENTFYLKGYAFSHSQIGTFLIKVSEFPHLKGLYIKHCEYKTGQDNKDTQNLVRFEAEARLSF